MSRRPKGPRLYLQPARRDKNGRITEYPTYLIRDGEMRIRTGCGPDGREQAEKCLADYLIKKHRPSKIEKRDPDEIPVADALNVWLADKGAKQARPKEVAARAERLIHFFAPYMIGQVNDSLCLEYVAHRRSESAARRELQDLHAAFRYHHELRLSTYAVPVALPDKAPSRETWITRGQAAALLLKAWRYREMQKGKPTGKRSRQHVARFMLVALYTGTRAGAICAAALKPTPGHGWIDLENGIFYRRASGERETRKRKPPIRLPDALLAHLRRWHAKGKSVNFVVEFNGKPIKRVSKAMARVVEDAGLPTSGPDKITPHVWRHTAATWQMQAGTDPWEAGGFLGMSTETLIRVYGHHHPDFLEGARNAYGRMKRKKPETRTPADSGRMNETEREQSAGINAPAAAKKRAG